MGQFNIKFRFDKYFNEVDGMLVLHILHNLILFFKT